MSPLVALSREGEEIVALATRLAAVHRDVIARFGRFPHRNPLLSRHTTPAERAFLEGGGFGG